MNTKEAISYGRAHGPSMVQRTDGSVDVWYPPPAIPVGAAADAGTRAIETLTRLQLTFCSTSLAVAARLQLGSIYSGSTNVEGKAIFYDAVATTDFEAEAVELNGDVLYTVRHGIGLRLAMKAINLKVDTNLSYSMVAAQARGLGAEVFYEVQGIGIPPEIVKSLLGAMPTLGPLNETSYTRLDHVLRVELPDYLADEAKPLTTTEYIVVPRDSGDPFLAQSRAFNVAISQIARGRSLSKALRAVSEDETLAGGAGRFLFLYAYSKFTGTADPASTVGPSAAAINRAKAWLNV